MQQGPSTHSMLPKPEMVKSTQMWELEKPFPRFYGLVSQDGSNDPPQGLI